MCLFADRRKYFGCTKKHTSEAPFRQIFEVAAPSAKRASSSSGQKRKRHLDELVAGNVPQTRTLRTWVDKFFDKWVATHAESEADVDSDVSFQDGGAWTCNSIAKFFLAKDREFNTQPASSGEKLLQLCFIQGIEV
jgi:hypothetical protein